MREALGLAAYILVVGTAWGGALFAVGGNTERPARPARSAAVSEPAKPIPCFFLGQPYSRDPRACKQFGGVRLVMWETYCQPDETCTKNPDGTDYLNP